MRMKKYVRIAQSLCLVTAAMVGTPFLLMGAPAPARAQQPSPDELIAPAKALIDIKKYAPAAEKLEQFLKLYPNEKRVPAAALTLGRAYINLNRYDDAVAPYEKASRSSDPAISSAALLGLGEASLKSKKPDYTKAAQSLEGALKSKTIGEDAAVATFWLGQSYFGMGKYAQSQEAYARVTREFPKSDLVSDAYFNSGLAALKQDKNDAAAGFFKVVVDKYQSSEDRPQAMLFLAQIDALGKRWKEASAGFEKVLSDPKAKNNKDIANQAEEGLVRSLLEQGNFTAAAPRLQSLLNRLSPSDPLRPRTALSLGNALYLQKQYDPAITAYKEALRASDAAIAGEASYWTGSSYLAQKKPAEAAAAFTDMVNKYPTNTFAPKAALYAGDAYTDLKKPADALKMYNLVLAKYPTSKEAEEAKKARTSALLADGADTSFLETELNNLSGNEKAYAVIKLARVSLDKKNYPAMVTVLGKAPTSGIDADAQSEVQYLLGIAYEQQGKDKPSMNSNAVKAYTDSIRLGEKTQFAADAQTRLPALYLDMKQPADAQRAAEAALSRSPTPEVGRQLRLTLAQALIDQNKFDPAIDVTRQILASNPPADITASVLQTQAFLYEKANRPNDALPIWEKIAADKNSPAAPDALLRVGDAKLKANQLDAAREKYAMVTTQFPNSKAAIDARYKLATTLYNLKRYPEAATEYDKLGSTKGGEQYADEALYWGAYAYEQSKKSPEAMQRFKELISKYPKSQYVEKARVRLAVLQALNGG